MRTTPFLLAQFRACYAKKTSEVDIINALADAELLVLDDVGAERSTDTAREWLFTIIDERYLLRRPIVITSNLPLTALGEQIGERTVDRLLQMSRVVYADKATSRRVEEFKEKNSKPWRDIGDRD
jgi:DNA replication protein DnaC